MLENGEGSPMNKYFNDVTEANPKEAFNYRKIAAENDNDIPINREEGLKYIKNVAAYLDLDILLYYYQLLEKGD